MSNLPLGPAALILFILTTATAVFFYLREHNKRRKLETEGDKFLEAIKVKGWETLNQSIKKSQAIIGEAEIEGVKALAGDKIEISKMEQDFAQNLAQALNESKTTIASAQGQLLQFMQDLQKRSAEFEEASKRVGEQRINQLFDRVETRLSDFLMQTEQKTTYSIELELKAARQLIDTYKSEQLKLIDENIVAVIEQTLTLVLTKKLSLQDQLDLVYEALEKAKIQKFIV